MQNDVKVSRGYNWISNNKHIQRKKSSKYALACYGFGHIHWKNPYLKTSFFV